MKGLVWAGAAMVALGAGAGIVLAAGGGDKAAGSQPATRAAVAADFVRYERVRPVFKAKALAKPDGDAVVAALHGGAALEADWSRHAAAIGHFGDFTCILPPATPIEIDGVRADGSRYEIHLAGSGAVVWLGKGSEGGLYGLSDDAAGEMKTAIATLQADLKAEILSAHRPMTYVVGTLEGDDSLSAMARIFFGNAGRWKDIYAANRRTLKNPDTVNAGMKLVIPP